MPVAQSCLECGRPVPSALCLVLVDLFPASNLRMLSASRCSVENSQKNCLINEWNPDVVVGQLMMEIGFSEKLIDNIRHSLFLKK